MQWQGDTVFRSQSVGADVEEHFAIQKYEVNEANVGGVEHAIAPARARTFGERHAGSHAQAIMQEIPVRLMIPDALNYLLSLLASEN